MSRPISEAAACELHAQVLRAFDEGTTRPSSGRSRERTTAEGKVITFSPKYFHVRSEFPITVFQLMHFLSDVLKEAADLKRGWDCQVTTLVGENYITAVASSVVESELGVQYRDDITCFYRIATLRRL